MGNNFETLQAQTQNLFNGAKFRYMFLLLSGKDIPPGVASYLFMW